MIREPPSHLQKGNGSPKRGSRRKPNQIMAPGRALVKKHSWRNAEHTESQPTLISQELRHTTQRTRRAPLRGLLSRFEFCPYRIRHFFCEQYQNRCRRKNKQHWVESQTSRRLIFTSPDPETTTSASTVDRKESFFSREAEGCPPHITA